MPLAPPDPARDRFYSAVGTGIATWASLENHLVLLAALLLDTPAAKAGCIFYSIPNFHSWLAIIDELFEAEPRARIHKAKWNKIATKLRGLNDTRVRVAHQSLPIIDGKFPYLELRPSDLDPRTKTRKQAPLTAPDILEFASATIQAMRDIATICDSLAAEPSPGKRSRPTLDPR